MQTLWRVDLVTVDANDFGAGPKELAEPHGELVETRANDDHDIGLGDGLHSPVLPEASSDPEVEAIVSKDAAGERGRRGERTEPLGERCKL